MAERYQSLQSSAMASTIRKDGGRAALSTTTITGSSHQCPSMDSKQVTRELSASTEEASVLASDFFSQNARGEEPY